MLTGLLGSLLLNRLLRFELLTACPVIRLAVGLILGITSITIGVTSLWKLKQANTARDPLQPTTSIVVDGPFRFSRNPLYVALLIFIAGWSFNFATWWPLILIPIIALTLHYAVVIPEENYLEGKFGDDYLKYKTRVRRWL